MSSMFECTKCEYHTRLYSRLLSHYRFAHSSDRNFFVVCGVERCQKSYSVVDSLIRHIKRKHTIFYETHLSRWKQDIRDPEVLDTLSEQIDHCDNHDNCIQDNGNENAQETEHEIVQDSPDHVRKLAIFLMTLRERFGVTISTLTFILSEIGSMFNYHQAFQSRNIHSLLNEHNVNDPELLANLEHLFRQKSEVESSFETLNSEYKLEKYMRTNFKFIPSEEYILGTDETGQNETYQYISVIRTIQGLLEYDDVFSYVLNSHQSEGDLLGDICDGELYRSHPLFSVDKSALQIILYYDDFTVTNPLGTKTKKFKLGAFYMMLGNLPPKHRSQLYTIQLVALCHSAHLKKYGFDSVLRPLIYDLNILETEGCTISKSGVQHRLFGSVLVVVADNLGAHGFGGFMESFSCLRNCRFCFCTRDHMNENIECRNFTRRTKETYDQQVEYVKVDSSMSSVYGIKSSCCLNVLENFHAVNCLPSDIAHDLFEGILSDILKLLICYCVGSKFFTLNQLNKCIKEHPYADTDKVNKPSQVMSTLNKFNVKQTAAQMWCLFRLLPIFIGDKVPQDDAKWQTYLSMRDVLMYVCAPKLQKGHVSVMEDLIDDFQESFTTT